VVDPRDFQLYTWEHWAKLQPGQGERFIQARERAAARAGSGHPAGLRPRADAYVTFSRRNLFKRDHNTCSIAGRSRARRN